MNKSLPFCPASCDIRGVVFWSVVSHINFFFVFMFDLRRRVPEGKKLQETRIHRWPVVRVVGATGDPEPTEFQFLLGEPRDRALAGLSSERDQKHRSVERHKPAGQDGDRPVTGLSFRPGVDRTNDR